MLEECSLYYLIRHDLQLHAFCLKRKGQLHSEITNIHSLGEQL